MFNETTAIIVTIIKGLSDGKKDAVYPQITFVIYFCMAKIFCN